MPLVVLVPLLGVCDKTVFLAARAEHFWVTIADAKSGRIERGELGVEGLRARQPWAA